MFRLSGQQWDYDKVDPKRKGKDISIMIWGAIWIGGRSDCIIMPRDKQSPGGGVTTKCYLEVLEDQLPRIYEPGLVLCRITPRSILLEL